LAGFCESGDHEEIHKLRVEFKKIRALVSLVKECSDNSLIPREFRTAKVVYKRAGVVRDAYIAHQQHISISPNDPLGDGKYLELSSQQFCSKKDLHLRVINEWRDIVKEQFENISNNCAAAFYRKRLARLEDRFYDFREDELHECRKLIKMLMYLYPLMSEAVKNELMVNIDYLDSLQEEIGKWHDTLIAHQHYSDLGEPNITHLKHLEGETTSRLNSIKLLTKNFHDKFSSA
jgi:CHAD domain-containing protein